MRVHDHNMTVERLREMASRNQYTKDIFEHFAGRSYNAQTIGFNRLQTLVPNVPEQEMLALFKDLEREGLGRINWGRNGAKSGFMWYYSVIDVGKAGLGLKDTITGLNPLYDADGDIFSQDASRHKVPLRDGEFSSTVVLPRDYDRQDIEAIIRALRELPVAA